LKIGATAGWKPALRARADMVAAFMHTRWKNYLRACLIPGQPWPIHPFAPILNPIRSRNQGFVGALERARLWRVVFGVAPKTSCAPTFGGPSQKKRVGTSVRARRPNAPARRGRSPTSAFGIKAVVCGIMAPKSASGSKPGRRVALCSGCKTRHFQNAGPAAAAKATISQSSVLQRLRELCFQNVGPAASAGARFGQPAVSAVPARATISQSSVLQRLQNAFSAPRWVAQRLRERRLANRRFCSGCRRHVWPNAGLRSACKSRDLPIVGLAAAAEGRCLPTLARAAPAKATIS